MLPSLEFQSQELLLGVATQEIKGVLGSLPTLAATAAPLVAASESIATYDPAIRADWIKISDFLREFKVNGTAHSKVLNTYLDTCRNVWDRFERMVPYASRCKCASPGCAKLDPHIACKGCVAVLYCSSKCQERYGYDIQLQEQLS